MTGGAWRLRLWGFAFKYGTSEKYEMNLLKIEDDTQWTTGRSITGIYKRTKETARKQRGLRFIKQRKNHSDFRAQLTSLVGAFSYPLTIDLEPLQLIYCYQKATY